MIRKRIGFENNTVTVAQYEEMQKAAPQVEWSGVNGLIENVRAVKDADELALTQKTIDLAEDGLRYLLTCIKPGMTEKQVAWELEVYLRTHGADALSFDTIVASGPNAALPHHHPGERVIQANEPITIDWGAAIDGYRSDLTRTIVLGEPDAKFREVYGIVLKAQLNAINNIKAGQTGQRGGCLRARCDRRRRVRRLLRARPGPRRRFGGARTAARELHGRRRAPARELDSHRRAGDLPAGLGRRAHRGYDSGEGRREVRSAESFEKVIVSEE